MRPSELAEVTPLPICVRDVSGSNLDRGANYPEGFLWSSSVPPGEFRDITLDYGMVPSFHILSHQSLSSNHSILYSLSY
jgi:hypothetical protein